MIEATVSVVGNVATKPRLAYAANGAAYTHFRLAANGSRFDRRSRSWVNDEASYYTVFCWRAPLADNVNNSLDVGHPIYVHGRMRVREWTDDKDARHWLAEIDARAIGHDLYRGTTVYQKPPDKTSLEAEDNAIERTRNEYFGHAAEVPDEDVVAADAGADTGKVDLVTGEILGVADDAETESEEVPAVSAV